MHTQLRILARWRAAGTAPQPSTTANLRSALFAPPAGRHPRRITNAITKPDAAFVRGFPASRSMNQP